MPIRSTTLRLNEDDEFPDPNGAIRVINTTEAKHYADALAISIDLRFVRDSAAKLVEMLPTDDGVLSDADSLMVDALATAALVAYARCFTSGKRSALQVPPGSETFHQLLKDMRDKHIAHSVNPFHRVAVGIRLARKGDRLTIESVSGVSVRLIAFSRAQFQTLVEYIDAILAALAGTLKDLERKVRQVAESMTQAELQALPPARIVAPDRDQAGKGRPD